LLNLKNLLLLDKKILRITLLWSNKC